MDIFVDDEFHSGTRPSVVPEPVGVHVPAATWKNLGTQKEVRKENDQRPSKWNETTLPRLGKVSKHVEARPPIEVFVDEECEEAHARLKVKNASASSTTLRQRVDGVCDLRRSVYLCRELWHLSAVRKSAFKLVIHLLLIIRKILCSVGRT